LSVRPFSISIVIPVSVSSNGYHDWMCASELCDTRSGATAQRPFDRICCDTGQWFHHGNIDRSRMISPA
jgi:hypothetical protein